MGNRQSKNSELVELTKGTLKGVIGTACRLTILGQPAADGIYESIQSDTGKNVYWLTHGIILGVMGTAAAYYLTK